MLHFSSDSYIASDVSNENWILNAINIMEKDEDIIVANPTWNYRWNEAKSEADDENKLFWIGQGFSDQCYLIDVNIFKDKIYNYYHEASERYPKYGGNSFEKRVDCFMRCNNKKRLTSKNISYVSKNINIWQYISEKFWKKI